MGGVSHLGAGGGTGGELLSALSREASLQGTAVNAEMHGWGPRCGEQVVEDSDANAAPSKHCRGSGKYARA